MIKMEDKNKHVRKWHGRRPFQIDDEYIIDFIGITKGMKVLDVGGADGYYSLKIAERGANVTLIDAHDYNFNELREAGIKTVLKDFCGYSEENYDLVFMAHVYHDLVRICKKKTLENLSKITGKYIANLDFTKQYSGFGPPVEERLEKGDVVEDMMTIGFKLRKDTDIPYHYLQLFERE
ncbi:MAG: hypothetical protein QXU18_11745 [Thermoplasmatales archaeon]